MKIKEILKKMNGFSDKERGAILKSLLNKLCPVSLNQMSSFQSDWDGERTFEEFKEEQNKVLRYCVEMETSEIGSLVREEMGLSPISLETEI